MVSRLVLFLFLIITTFYKNFSNSSSTPNTTNSPENNFIIISVDEQSQIYNNKLYAPSNYTQKLNTLEYIFNLTNGECLSSAMVEIESNKNFSMDLSNIEIWGIITNDLKITKDSVSLIPNVSYQLSSYVEKSLLYQMIILI